MISAVCAPKQFYKNDKHLDEDPLENCNSGEVCDEKPRRGVIFPSQTLDLSTIRQFNRNDNTECPDQEYVDYFLDRSKFVTRAEGRVVIGGKYYFNWLSPNDYVANWESLDDHTRSVFNTLLTADSSPSNRCYYGLKEHDSLPEHLLLLTGAEIWNLFPDRPTDMVTANLKFDGFRYSPTMVSSRILDSRTAMDAIHDFERIYNPAVMFKDFDAAILLIDSPVHLREIRDNSDVVRDAYKQFFKENSAFLGGQIDKWKIFSYIYSNEISVTSIRRREFCPHTHFVAFYPKGTELPLVEMQADLAAVHPDRKLTMHTTGVPDGVHTSYRTLKDFCKYLYKVSTLAKTYRREFSYDCARDININTIHCLRTLVELTTGTGDKKKRFQQTGCVGIAKCCDKGRKYVHPELKKLQRKDAEKLLKAEKKAAKKLEKAEKKAAACSRRKNKVTKVRKCVKRDVVTPASEAPKKAAIPEPRLPKPDSGGRTCRKVINRRPIHCPSSNSSRRTMNTINIFRRARPVLRKAAHRSYAWSRAGPKQTHNNQRLWMNR